MVYYYAVGSAGHSHISFVGYWSSLYLVVVSFREIYAYKTNFWKISE